MDFCRVLIESQRSARGFPFRPTRQHLALLAAAVLVLLLVQLGTFIAMAPPAATPLSSSVRASRTSDPHGPSVDSPADNATRDGLILKALHMASDAVVARVGPASEARLRARSAAIAAAKKRQSELRAARATQAARLLETLLLANASKRTVQQTSEQPTAESEQRTTSERAAVWPTARGISSPPLPAANVSVASPAHATRATATDDHATWTAEDARRKLASWWQDVHLAALRLGYNVSEHSGTVTGSTGAARFTHSPAWKHRCRRFGVGSRHDYQGSIRTALRELGLCETHSSHWEVYWGEQWLKPEQFERHELAPTGLVNSIPGFRASFGDKFAFARLHEGCLARQEANRTAGGDGDVFCGWTKRGFNYVRRGAQHVEGPVGEFRRHALAIAASRGGDRNELPQQLWILKPQQSFNQVGISLVYLEAADIASDVATHAWLARSLPLDGSWTLQEYVKHPLLYRERKFDLRGATWRFNSGLAAAALWPHMRSVSGTHALLYEIPVCAAHPSASPYPTPSPSRARTAWAVITSIDPLRLYMLERAFPKISTVPYSADGDLVGRHCLSSPTCACMHVRMPLGEGCDKAALVAPYPPHTGTALFQRGLRFGPTFRGRGDVGQEATLWEREVIPQMGRALLAAVLLAREGEPLRLHRRLKAGGARYRRVLMLSPDFIVDEAGSAFLEEVNTNGFMVGDDELFTAQVASDGFRWPPMASDGFRWLPMASDGFRWLPIASDSF